MAQTQLRTKFAQIHLVEETSQDTYLAPAGSGAGLFMAQDVTVAYSAEDYESTEVRGDGLTADGSAGPCTGTITFRCPVKGSGTAGTAPQFGEALKACGYEETVVGATSVAYTPLLLFDGAGGNPGPSYSVSYLLAGTRHAIKGAFGNVSFVGGVTGGEPAFLEFEMQGAYVEFAADGLETASYQTTAPPAFLGASFALNIGGAYTPKGTQRFTLNTGNQITIGRDINESSGIYGARIVSRRSTGEFDPELVAQATFDFFGLARAKTAGTITTGTIGSTAGNRYAVSIARAQLGMPTYSDREGIGALTVPYNVTSARTDVEGTNADITFLFT